MIVFKREKNLILRLKKADIYIDGVKKGTIGNGENKAVNIEKGIHQVIIKIGNKKSNVLTIKVDSEYDRVLKILIEDTFLKKSIHLIDEENKTHKKALLNKINLKSLHLEALNTLFNNFKFVKILISTYIFSLLFNILISFYLIISTSIFKLDNFELNIFKDGFFQFMPQKLILTITGVVILGPLLIGLYKFVVRILEKNEIDINNLLYGYKKFYKTIKLHLVLSIKIILSLSLGLALFMFLISYLQFDVRNPIIFKFYVSILLIIYSYILSRYIFIYLVYLDNEHLKIKYIMKKNKKLLKDFKLLPFLILSITFIIALLIGFNNNILYALQISYCINLYIVYKNYNILE